MLDCIGIDVSKSTLNVHISKNSQDLQIDNTLGSVKKLYGKLKKLYTKELEEVVFIFEPTGSYSELLRKFFSYFKNRACLSKKVSYKS